MGLFLLRRLGVMLLTALCLTFVVFFLTNLYPNLEKLAKTQGNFRMSDRDVSSWLTSRGYTRPMLVKYGEWLGVVPGYVSDGADGTTRARCATGGTPVADAPKFCGVLQGKWGFSTRAKEDAGVIMWRGLTLTGFLMMWALILTIPTALLIGVLAGMREGSKTDRTLSTFSAITAGLALATASRPIALKSNEHSCLLACRCVAQYVNPHRHSNPVNPTRLLQL